MASWLPSDVLQLLLSFVAPRLIVRNGRVCRAWRAAASSEALWQKLCAAEGLTLAPNATFQATFLYAACPEFRAHRFALMAADLERLRHGSLRTLMRTTTREEGAMLKSAALFFDAVWLTESNAPRKRTRSSDLVRDEDVEALLGRTRLVSDTGQQPGTHAWRVDVVVTITAVDGTALTIHLLECGADQFTAPCVVFVENNALFADSGGEPMTKDTGGSALAWSGVRLCRTVYPLLWNDYDEAFEFSMRNIDILKRATGFSGKWRTLLTTIVAIGSASRTRDRLDDADIEDDEDEKDEDDMDEDEQDEDDMDEDEM